MCSNFKDFSHFDEEMEVSASCIDYFFRPFIEGGGVQSLANKILDDDNLISLCASRSYRHVNGFDKIVLAEDAFGRKLTWHRWENPDLELQSDYHNHRWNFVSFVISGSVRLLDFQEEKNGHIEVEKLVYESPGGSDSFSLKNIGTTSLKQVRERTVYSGDFYFQPHRIVHKASPELPGTSTIIIQDVPAALRTDIYWPLGLEAPLKKSAQRFAVEEVRTALTKLV